MPAERVLVTGVAGFIGSAVSRALLSSGRAVFGIDSFSTNYPRALKEANLARLGHPRFSFAELDITESDSLADRVQSFRPDVVLHLAALGNVRASVRAPEPYVATNVVGTTNVLAAAVRTGVPHVVFASTSSVYGSRREVPFREADSTDRPLAPYPATKKACEVLGHAFHVSHGLSFTALRLFNVYGPHGRPDMMPWITLRALVENTPITVFGDGTVRRDWTYIDDIVEGLTQAIDRPLGYEVINLGRGEPVRLNDFIAILERLEGRSAEVVHREKPRSDPDLTFAAVDKARDLLGYVPTTDLATGLARFHEWWHGSEGRAGEGRAPRS